MRRQAMLEAARAVFAEKGYARATLEEVAQRAEFGKGTLYNYFEGGKEEILFAIFDELYDDFHHLITSSFVPAQTAGRPLREVFQAYFEASLAYFWERQDLFMILIKEAHRMTFGEDEDKALYFMRQHQRMVEALVPPLQAAMATGEMKPLPSNAVAHMILGSIQGAQMHVCFQDRVESAGSARPPSPQALAAFLTTMLFDGLTGHPQPASSPTSTSTTT